MQSGRGNLDSMPPDRHVLATPENVVRGFSLARARGTTPDYGRGRLSRVALQERLTPGPPLNAERYPANWLTADR